jgi:hypothetical protein
MLHTCTVEQVNPRVVVSLDGGLKELKERLPLNESTAAGAGASAYVCQAECVDFFLMKKKVAVALFVTCLSSLCTSFPRAPRTGPEDS